MEQKICQSCAMPLTSEDMYATEKDGSKNEDYCKWCYKDGEFIEKCTMEEFIDKCAQFGEQAGMTNEQMKEYCTKVFPTLKRWKKDQLMASSKEYRDFVLEQLSEAPGITCRAMMGEYVLYSDGLVFGGIYDDRLLVKRVPENAKYKMDEVIPYKNSKPLYFVEDVDDKEKLAEIVRDTVKGLLEAQKQI